MILFYRKCRSILFLLSLKYEKHICIERINSIWKTTKDMVGGYQYVKYIVTLN